MQYGSQIEGKLSSRTIPQTIIEFGKHLRFTQFSLALVCAFVLFSVFDDPLTEVQRAYSDIQIIQVARQEMLSDNWPEQEIQELRDALIQERAIPPQNDDYMISMDAGETVAMAQVVKDWYLGRADGTVSALWSGHIDRYGSKIRSYPAERGSKFGIIDLDLESLRDFEEFWNYLSINDSVHFLEVRLDGIVVIESAIIDAELLPETESPNLQRNLSGRGPLPDQLHLVSSSLLAEIGAHSTERSAIQSNAEEQFFSALTRFSSECLLVKRPDFIDTVGFIFTADCHEEEFRLLERLLRRINFSRPTGSFGETFPELFMLTKNIRELPMKNISEHLHELSKNTGTEIGYLGVSIPASDFKTIGVLIILITQFYFLSHVKKFLPILIDAGMRPDFPFILLYSDIASKIASVSTVSVLPVVATGLSLNEMMQNGELALQALLVAALAVSVVLAAYTAWLLSRIWRTIDG